MLRTFLIIGLIVVVGSALFGVLLGIAGVVLGFMIKLVILGAVVYLAIRIVSPRTAARIRGRIEGRTLPPL